MHKGARNVADLCASARRSARAFTLIELLVVVAIIGLISSVTITSLQNARINGRNGERNQIVTQYRNAIELARTANGTYPRPASIVCLGTYPAGCGGTYGYPQDAATNEALRPYVPSLPPLPTAGLPPEYTGLPYMVCPGFGFCTTMNIPNDTYTMAWVLEGSRRACGIGTRRTGNFGEFTICDYVHR